MTKKEKLIEDILLLNPTAKVSEYMTIKELKSILRENSAGAPEETETTTTEHEEIPDTEQQEEPEKPAETTDEDFATLQQRIAAATVPPETAKVKRKGVERTTRKRRKGQSDPDSFRIEGYILLLVTDTVFPFAFSALNNMLDKRIKLLASDLQLDEKQTQKLEPLADQAADYMQINLNPIAGFFLMSTFMYGNNLLTLRMKLEAELQPEKKEK